MSQPAFERLGLPPLPAWVRNLLVALFALYVVELLVKNTWPDLYSVLAWNSFGSGRFMPWQLFTRYFVQARDPMSVMFGLLLLFFSLPMLDRALAPRQLSQAAASVVVGGTVIAALFDLLGLAGGGTAGWYAFAGASFALLGLAYREQTVMLFFVLPVKGIGITVLECIVAVLLWLFSWDLLGAEQIGASAGVIGWWFLLGPGARRRQLVKQKAKIEKDLKKFQVINGGRNNPDDVFH